MQPGDLPGETASDQQPSFRADSAETQLRKYAEDLALLYRQENKARQELETRQHDLEILVETHGRLARCLSLDSSVDLLLEAFVALLGLPRALVYLRTAESDKFVFIRGRCAESVSVPSHPPSVSASHPLWQRLTAESQDAVLLQRNEREAAQWLEETYGKDRSPTQVLCLPLPSRSHVLGFVAIDDAGLGEAVIAGRRSVLDLMSRQAGILLENVQLYEQSQAELTTVRTLLSEEQQKLAGRHQFDSLIGASSQMQDIFGLLRTVADVDVPVLVVGETGTGKELVARALHYTSRRRNKPFVSVNCASLPSELVESELFGHEKGSFTGAVQRRIGKVEMAEGGTLFLDEISEMQANLQAKLLRFLQEQIFERVGGERPLQADVRIIAATNRDIDTAVRENKLRSDLLYRLNTFTVTLPPLRQRLDDVPLLVSHFVQQANERYGCRITEVAPAVYPLLLQHGWPGNIRELKNVIDRAAILTQEGAIGPQSIQVAREGFGGQPEDAAAPAAVPDERRSLTDLKQEVAEQFERSHMDRLLRQSGGNISQAARSARIDKKNFLDKMRRYNLNRDDYRPT